MEFQQLLLILRAQWEVVLYVLGVTVATTLIVCLVMPKQYTASTDIVVDIKSIDPVAGMWLPGLASTSYMATQMDIISSERVGQRVVKLLKLDESPASRQDWIDATDGKGQLVPWIADQLGKTLTVKPSDQSNMISIDFRAYDPAFAAAVANAYAQAYIDVNLELKVEPAHQYAVYFDQQTKAARDKLEQAQHALSDYQQKTGLMMSDTLVDFEAAKINDISGQLTLTQTQTADSMSKRSSTGIDSLQEVIQNPVIVNLKGQIADVESKLQQSNATFGKNYPTSQAMQSELDSLKARLDSETRRIYGGIEASYRSSKLKERELQGGIEAQKAKVLELNKQRDEMSVLKHDMEQAQHDFEAVSQRAAQSKLESQSVQTNISVLNLANEPVEPSRPKLLLYLAVSVLLGGVLGVGVALLLELSNRRIRSMAELAELTGVPVLAGIVSTEPPISNRAALLKFIGYPLARMAALLRKFSGRRKPFPAPVA